TRCCGPSAVRRPRASGAMPPCRAGSALPSPLRGRVGEGGATRTDLSCGTPLPVPPPQGGRERRECASKGPKELDAHREALLVPRLEVALAMIAALGATRRAIAGILLLVARPRLRAAGALYQHAAALAVIDERTL